VFVDACTKGRYRNFVILPEVRHDKGGFSRNDEVGLNCCHVLDGVLVSAKYYGILKLWGHLLREWSELDELQWTRGGREVRKDRLEVATW